MGWTQREPLESLLLRSKQERRGPDGIELTGSFQGFSIISAGNQVEHRKVGRVAMSGKSLPSPTFCLFSIKNRDVTPGL